VIALGIAGGRAGFVSYTDTGSAVTGAAVANVPSGSGVAFGRIDINLREGESAYLQYSVIEDGAQGNIVPEYLYDGNIVRLERKGYGTLITALKTGECVLQVVSLDGIKDAARITVGVREEDKVILPWR